MKLNLNKILGLMTEKQYNREYIAKYLGLAYNTLRNKLTGKTEFTANEIGKLSILFEVMIDELFEME